MNTQAMKPEEVEMRYLKYIIDLGLNNQQILTIQLPNGDEVVIHPKPSLKPLPVLEGHVPPDWKESIYS